MGLFDKVKTGRPSNGKEFTKNELEFLLTKLRTATYKGDEFEMFYNVWVKILDGIDKLKE